MFVSLSGCIARFEMKLKNRFSALALKMMMMIRKEPTEHFSTMAFCRKNNKGIFFILQWMQIFLNKYVCNTYYYILTKYNVLGTYLVAIYYLGL